MAQVNNNHINTLFLQIRANIVEHVWWLADNIAEQLPNNWRQTSLAAEIFAGTRMMTSLTIFIRLYYKYFYLLS